MHDSAFRGHVVTAPDLCPALRQALHSWDRLLEWLPIGVYACDRAGVVVQYNRRAAELWGQSPVPGDAQVRFCGAHKAFRPSGEPLPLSEAPMSEVLRTGKPIRDREVVVERPDGTRITILANLDPLFDQDGRIVGGVNCFQDISELKRAQEALRDSERRSRELLEALPAAIYTTDAAGRITFYNQAAADLAGRRPELGKDEWCVTWRLYLPDGTPLPHDQCPMAAALKEDRPVRGIDAVAERPDGTRVPFLPYPTPLRDASGALVGAVNMLVDISERKAAEEALRASEDRYRRLSETLEAQVAERTRALSEANERLRQEAEERERTEAALRQAQKMEAVGQLASGMAHDFNNLLTSVLGNLELLEMRLTDERLRKLVQAAARSARRGAQLNEQMLAFSRKQHLAPKPVDLNALVIGIEDMLRRTLGGTVEVTTSLASGLWPALVDPTQVELVILNLAINARDAMPLGGRVLIETRNVKASKLDKSVDLAPGDYVLISVADTGTGMTDEVLARACEPFYTTKGPGKGSGLGLAQVYGVAQQSGGGIRIKSAVGKGTTVEVYLPRSAAKADTTTSRGGSARTAPAGSRATVLVVDDQEDVREVTVAHLEALGYRVAQAASGRTALDLLGDGDAVDLLITDYAMPAMSGTELAEAVRAARPDLPVLIITGYADIADLDQQIDIAMFLKKPYRMDELAAAIERALHRESRRGKAAKIVTLRAGKR